VHKHRNLLAHAPERLLDEVSAVYNDMIYAQTRQEIEAKRKAFLRKWRVKCRAVADSLEEAGERLFTFVRFPAKPMEIDPNHQRHRTPARGIQVTDQNADRPAQRRNRRHALPGIAGLGANRDAQGRWV
jgi:transposase-like protein